MARLTDQQLEFVTAYTSVPGAIGNASEAARRSGYSTHSAREIGRQLLDKPHVQEAIHEANQRLISGQIATKAVALLERVIDDEGAPIKVRVEAAKTILDRGGFGAVPAGKSPFEEKHPSEMSAAELEKLVRRGEAHLSALMAEMTKPELIDVTPEREALPVATPEGI